MTHPLLSFRTRRHESNDGVWRGKRFIRDILLQRGVTQITFTQDKATPELGKDIHTMIMETLRTPPEYSRVTRWNLTDDMLESYKAGKSHKTTQARADRPPDPEYSKDAILMTDGRMFTEHLDLEMPRNLLPECKKIHEIVWRYKQHIANQCRAEYPKTSEDSLQMIVNHIDASLPLVWKADGIDPPLAVWNPAQPYLACLHPENSVMYKSENDPSYALLRGSSKSFKEYMITEHLDTLPHIHSHAMIPTRHISNKTDQLYPHFNFNPLSIQGLGSKLHAVHVAMYILRQDWPIPNLDIIDEIDISSDLYEIVPEKSATEFRQEIADSEETDSFCNEFQAAIQDLIKVVIPDQEVFQAILCKKNAEHHLYCNFVAKHPHIRQDAIDYPGIVYPAMLAYLHTMTRNEIANAYNCIHFGKSCSVVWNMLGSNQLDRSIEYLIPMKAYRKYIQDTSSTTQTLLDILYDSDTQAKYPKQKLLDMTKSIPNLYGNSVQSQYRESEMDRIPKGHSSGARPLYSPLHDLLFDEDIIKKELLEMDPEFFPQGEREWRLLVSHCLVTKDIYRGNLFQRICGMFRKKTHFQKTRASHRECHIMTELWKDSIVHFRKGDLTMLRKLDIHLHETHDMFDALQDCAEEIVDMLPRDIGQSVREAQTACLEAYVRKSVAQQEQNIQLWNTYSSYFPELEHYSQTQSGIEGEDLNPSWPVILQDKLELEDYTAQEINTTRQLRIHGSKMKHCVGTYTTKCLRKDAPLHIIEFLDPNGEPVATASYGEQPPHSPETEMVFDQFAGHYNADIMNDTLIRLEKICYNTCTEHYASMSEENKRQIMNTRETNLLKYENAKEYVEKHLRSSEAWNQNLYWNWRVLQKILPDLKDILGGQKYLEEPLPEWIPQ